MNDELFTEARRLADTLAAARHYECGDCWYSCPESEEGCCNDAETECNCSAPECHEAARLIAALLERAVTAEADRGEAERRERTAVNLANYHRDVARTAGGRAEHAETEARQLREAIGDPDELRWHRWHCEETSQGDDLRELLVRIADAAAAAVAEGAEDRGQTDG